MDLSPPDAGRWLLLALQLPATPSNARVKTWRRLQQLGAISVKNSVYVLPNSAQALEDFEWLRSEIEALNGQVNIFAASSIDGADDQDIVEQFQAARTLDYKALLRDAKALRARRGSRKTTTRTEDVTRAVRQLRDRFAQVRAVDFFEAPARQDVETALDEMERDMQPRTAPSPPTPARRTPSDFHKRVWVTRPRPGVDRFASAWLIRRFIDPDAQFAFAVDAKLAADAVAFDMYDTGFRHVGEACTFEVLCREFGITDGATRRIGEIVHDLDLKEDRYRIPHGVAIGTLVEGLRATIADDAELLREGMLLFEALYRGFGDAPAPHAKSTRGRKRRS